MKGNYDSSYNITERRQNCSFVQWVFGDTWRRMTIGSALFYIKVYVNKFLIYLWLFFNSQIMQGCTCVKNTFHERVGFKPVLVFYKSHEFGIVNGMLYPCIDYRNLPVEFFLLIRKYRESSGKRSEAFLSVCAGISPIVSRLRRRIWSKQYTNVLQCFWFIPKQTA